MNILEELKKEREVLRRMLTQMDLAGLSHCLYTEQKLFNEYVAYVQSAAYEDEYYEYIKEDCGC